MADIHEPASVGEGKHGEARRVAEAAVRAERAGLFDEAERLLSEARRIDPAAVEDLLMETGAGAKRDAAEVPNDEEVARISREIRPHSDAPSRSGITGSGSGADGG